MTGLTLAMLRGRPWQAVTMFLLAVVAVAAAVAGPAFLAAADRSVIAVEVGHARPAELALEAQTTVDLTRSRDRTFESTVLAALTDRDLTPVFAAEFDSYLTGPAASVSPRLAFRDGVCAHLTMVSGRCPIGTREVIVGEADAGTLGVHIGQTVLEQEVVRTPDGPAARGPVAVLAVVGVYRVTDPAEQYWADQHYFDVAPPGSGQTWPAFTVRGTMEALSHQHERQSVDTLLNPAALTPSGLPAVQAEVRAAKSRGTWGGVGLTTGSDALFGRIAADRATLREVVPLAAVSLVLLAWLVLLMTAGHAGDARRAELGLLRLRGIGRPTRWWLAFGETGLAVLLGAPVGYLLGYGLVAASARSLMPDAGPVSPSWQPLRWAALALLGALAATVVAQRRSLVAPASDLLRQVPPRDAAWRGPAAEAMLYTLAVAAVVQLHSGSGRLTGASLLAPALVLLAVALLAARAAGPVIGWLGARALRRGRLRTALGALRLARRPGAPRLLALLVVAVAQLCLAAAATDVAARARDQRADVELGATRVLTVRPISRTALLHAVRAADPDGRYAMAVATVPRLNSSDPPLLAVDSTRLARVAVWGPEYGVPAPSAVAAALRPPAPAPIVLTTRSVGVELTAAPTVRLRLFVHLAPLDGSPTLLVDLGDLVAGRHRYVTTVAGCRDGCRLSALELAKPSGGAFDVRIVLHAMYQDDPATPAPVDFVHSGHWRTPAPEEGATAPVLQPGPDGLTVDIHDGGSGMDASVMPVDAAYPLPVVSAGRPVPSPVGGLDGRAQPVTAAGTVAVLPRVGTSGGLVDLEYADRDTTAYGEALSPQVWLSADAPAGLTDRLRAAGLTIVDSQSDVDRVRYLSQQGPGTGLRFHLLAGALGLALALAALLVVAAVDRRGTGTLDPLRVQGVRRAVLRSAVRRGYLGLVLSALLLGPLAAAAAWLATGGRIPLFADGAVVLAPPAWPGWLAPLLAWAASGLLLLGTALVAAGPAAGGRPADTSGPLP